MLKLKPLIYQLPEFDTLSELLKRKRNFRLKGIYGSFFALVINYIREATNAPQLVIVPTADEAEKLSDDLNAFIPTAQALYYPADEIMPFDQGMFSPTLYSLRLNALAALNEYEAPVIVTTPAALLKRVPAPETFRKNILRLREGEDFERELLIEWLVECGYERVPIIEEYGQFSVRGGILDVFSFESELPCRIEFFGDTIESIREFEVLSQLSVEPVQHVRLIGQPPEVETTANLVEYLPAPSIVFWIEGERAREKMKEWWEEACFRWEHQGSENPLSQPPQERYVPFSEILTRLEKFLTIEHSHLGPAAHTQSLFNVAPPAAFHGNVKMLIEHLTKCTGKSSVNGSRQMFVLYDSKSSRQRLEEILESEMGELPPIRFVEGGLHSGFFLPNHHLEVLTDHDIFSRLKVRRRKKRLRVSGSLIRNLQALEYGDFVVHVDYGVGKYVGTERISVAGREKECIKLIYEGEDVLYVTLDKLNRIQRYVGEEGYQPKLTKLGSSEWERVKKRTRKAAEGIARELVQLYARRMSQSGHPFAEDGVWQKELEASFPFEDTPDQARATEEMKRDMESARPMDRLICGDVGYGKTEIAVRAAFKAVNDGRQVAILVPTTILAQQHYTTFSKRLANFPVNVEVISRFRSRKAQKEVLERLAGGEVDVVIGTHRLLSKDVAFKDLGLLIVDEEQRFGVSHKEKLKELKVTVDTLTLTATPIPRTLHMSLMGARDLSIVDTPPGNRVPIITEITTWDQQLIYKAITFEMERGGQVFFVHNRVQTIDAVANMVKSIVPKARLAVAHGQMNERQLEKIMDDFHHQKFDVLVATMIIENGLDIPNCNTIIVNRADRFGLAQLYQLRGRVGRSDRQAYAYLIIPPQERLNDTAVKRLYAIEEFGDLGSGMKIAMRDLEIRGAGNLLGHKQSGFINAVGYDLYQKILRETVESIQQETLPEHHLEDRLPMVDASVEIDLDMYFPDDYIPSPNEKVMIYHRLLNLDNLHLIENLANELRDRFGPLPEEAENLIEMVQIKKLASKLYIKQVKVHRQQLTLVFDERATRKDVFVEKELPRYINQEIAPLKFVQTETLKAVITLKGNSAADRLSFAKYFLRNL